ncbi:MAG: hypothetical protein PHO02_00605 [Candidatus Nanoarchaeia archaeon]|nr:hypothetical protein [Candidatus Nanoarchaeia archaeon]
MASTLARWVVEKGVDNINPSMLSAEMRSDIMTEAGIILLNEGRIYEAVKAVVMAGNSDKLVDMGDEFVRQTKFEEAALCFIPVKDKDKLEKTAAECAKLGNMSLAYFAYVAAGNDQMASFFKENFCPEL